MRIPTRCAEEMKTFHYLAKSLGMDVPELMKQCNGHAAPFTAQATGLAPLLDGGGRGFGQFASTEFVRNLTSRVRLGPLNSVGNDTHPLQGGIDLRTVQTWMGHTDVASTMRYLRPACGEKVQAQVEAPKQHLVFCTPGNADDADVMRPRQSSVLPRPLAGVL